MGKVMTQIWMCTLVALVLLGVGAVDAGTRRDLGGLVATRCVQAQIVGAKLYRKAKRPVYSVSRVRSFCSAAGLSLVPEQLVPDSHGISLRLGDVRDALAQMQRSLQGAH